MHKLKYILAFIFIFSSALVTYAQVDFFFSDAQKPDSFKVNFEIKDSLLYVQAIVNHKPEKFFFDNGCPLLVINTAHWYTAMSIDSNVSARGVGGKVEAGSVFINSFNWNWLQKDSFKVMAATLPNLDKNICGLMGYDVFKDYRVAFDLDSNILKFQKSSITLAANASDSLLRIPFTLEGHLPVIRMVIGRDSFSVAIDCGANQNLLSAQFLTVIKSVSNLKTTVLRGAGDPILVKTGIIDSAYISGLLYRNMQFTFDNVSLTQLNKTTASKVDGLLGFPFFKQYQTTIDFPNRMVEIKRR